MPSSPVPSPTPTPPAQPPPQSSPDKELTVLIKSPTDAPGTPAFSLSLPRSALVRDAKSALALLYPGRPPASTQRLIHAGKLLDDATPLAESLTGDPPQVVHLVAAPRSPAARRPPAPALNPVQTPEAPAQPAPAPAPAAVPTPPPAADGAGYLAHIQEVEAAFARLLHHQERYFALVRAQPPAPREAVAAELAHVGAAIAEYDASTQRQRDAIRAAAGAAPVMPLPHPHPLPMGFPAVPGFQGPAGFQALPGFQALMYQAGVPMPPGLVPPPPGAVPPGPAPALGAPGPAVWRRHFVLQLDLNWALLAKLAFFVFLLAQEGSPKRTKFLFALAVFIYLWQTGHLGFLRRLLAVMLPSPNQLFVTISAMASAADGDPGRESRVVPRNMLIRKAAVIFSYLYSFCYGFVCSLLPSWNPEPLPPLFHLFTLPPDNDEHEEEQAPGLPDGAANQAMPPPDPNGRPNDIPRDAIHAHLD